MRRKCLLGLVCLGLVSLLLALAQPKPQGLLLLEWAKAAAEPAKEVAVLLEMGLTDTEPSDWSGKAHVSGGRMVQREGYRFRDKDAIQGDSWSAHTRRPIRLPKGQPALARMEGIDSVGIVFHLADLAPDAALQVEIPSRQPPKQTVPLADILAGKSVYLWDKAAVVRLVSTATPAVTQATEDDFPAACYAPDGTLWLAYIAYKLRDATRQIEAPQLSEMPSAFRQFYRPEFADQLWVRYYRRGKWSPPIAITGPQEDLVRCAIAAQKDGKILVFYSAQRQGNFDIYMRSLELPAEPGLTPNIGRETLISEDSPGPDLGPVACTDQHGRVWMAWQSWDSTGKATIRFCTIEDNKITQSGRLATTTQTNQWAPAIAAAADGRVAIAFDVYNGDYDVYVAIIEGGKISFHPLATSAKFEARPSIVWDEAGRLWIAYEEGTERWGKDFGAFDTEGQPLYGSRSVRVVCWHNGKLLEPVAELPISQVEPPKMPYEPLAATRFERTPRYSHPRLGLDGQGRLWLSYRQKFGTRYSTHPGSYWLSFLRCLEGKTWSEPIELHHSCNLMDSRPVLLPHASGGLLVLHNTDGRYTTPDKVGFEIYASYLNLPGRPLAPQLRDRSPGQKDLAEAEKERNIVRRMRDYQVRVGGKTYYLLRGEFHRHTEISWDGGPDGCLEDMFRYAIDAVAFDWIGNGDHDNGAGREYTWWLTQKLTDAYHVPGVFTPMFTYERSVNYPHGHRNVMFAKRGVLTLPRLAEPDPQKQVGGVHADDTKMLYRYLRQLGGICAAHTSATNMGTDWRDNDPLVEPIVEIYQGDRMNYEYPDCPRAGYDPKSGKFPPQIGGWQPSGYINNALAKGYRLGFQSSSDHWSTHISYFVALAERRDREALLDAARKRHCYAATDNIIFDVRSGPYTMGDEWEAVQSPVFQVFVHGTANIRQLDVLRDSQVVATIPGKQSDKLQVAWTDSKPEKPLHYYYFRVLQEDGELAWSSPMWVRYKGGN
uniref:Hypothetical conserved protein n=1 Tax=uncultured Planctomycetota bacterium TaxID=120965 RepID=H5SCS9_9BACT|nr:hypothetical conserved protein [uncultured Planctomycetota bacterium]